VKERKKKRKKNKGWRRYFIKLTEDGVVGVHGDLVLGGIADEPLRVREGDVARRGAITLVIGDNLDLSMLENTDARVRSTQVNTNCGCLGHFLLLCLE
jgi:hypothetical protein